MPSSKRRTRTRRPVPDSSSDAETISRLLAETEALAEKLEALAQAHEAEAIRLRAERARLVGGARADLTGQRAPMQEKAIAFLKQTPDAGYTELTAYLYDSTNAATLNRARVLIAKLRENRIIAGPPGHWKVLRPDIGGGPM